MITQRDINDLRVFLSGQVYKVKKEIEKSLEKIGEDLSEHKREFTDTKSKLADKVNKAEFNRLISILEDRKLFTPDVSDSITNPK